MYCAALETTLAEQQFFRALAKLIGRRVARLSVCEIAAIASRMGMSGKVVRSVLIGVCTMRVVILHDDGQIVQKINGHTHMF